MEHDQQSEETEDEEFLDGDTSRVNVHTGPIQLLTEAVGVQNTTGTLDDKGAKTMVSVFGIDMISRRALTLYRAR